MNQILGGRQAQLRIVEVIGRVSKVVSAFNPHDSRIFHAAALFVGGFGKEDGIGTHREVKPVGAFGVPDARGSRPIASAKQEHGFFAHQNRSGIKSPGARPFPAGD